MASGGYTSEGTDMEEGSFSEDQSDQTVQYSVSTHNRYEQRENGGYGDFKPVSRKRKKGSSGSVDAFAGMQTDEKLICIFEQLNRNYEKIKEVEVQQASCKREMQNVNKGYTDLEARVRKIEELCQYQQWSSKVLSYKSIDSEARSMRNNLVIYNLTERMRYDSKSLVLNFLENELDLDTSEMKIERAHRMGKYRDRDSKRPMVVRFRDYVDTEIIMAKAYKLKGSNIGIDRQYPKEISMARSKLYTSDEAKEARAKRQKVQIRYPARLFIDGKCCRDMFPDWFKVLSTDRLTDTHIHRDHDRDVNRNHDRGYSESTVIDDEEPTTDVDDDNDNEVFELNDNAMNQNVNKHKSRDKDLSAQSDSKKANKINNVLPENGSEHSRGEEPEIKPNKKDTKSPKSKQTHEQAKSQVRATGIPQGKSSGVSAKYNSTTGRGDVKRTKPGSRNRSHSVNGRGNLKPPGSAKNSKHSRGSSTSETNEDRGQNEK